MSEPADTLRSLKDRIIAHRELQKVQVNAFGETLFVHEIDARRRDQLEMFQARGAVDHGDDFVRDNWRACWLIASLHDADGRPVFEFADLEAAAALPSRDVRRVYKLAARLNGVGEDDEGDAGN